MSSLWLRKRGRSNDRLGRVWCEEAGNLTHFFNFLENVAMTREEELNLLSDYIKKNGTTKLPPDARIAMNSVSVWTRDDKKRKKPKKVLTNS